MGGTTPLAATPDAALFIHCTGATSPRQQSEFTIVALQRLRQPQFTAEDRRAGSVAPQCGAACGRQRQIGGSERMPCCGYRQHRCCVERYAADDVPGTFLQRLVQQLQRSACRRLLSTEPVVALTPRRTSAGRSGLAMEL